MAPTLKILGVVSRFLYSGGWQVCSYLDDLLVPLKMFSLKSSHTRSVSSTFKAIEPRKVSVSKCAYFSFDIKV